MAKQRPFSFKIGADPEFILLAGEKFVTAHTAIKQFVSKAKHAREGNGGYNIGNHGNLGWDGASMIAEIRPTAEDRPEILASHIGVLIKTLVNQMPFVDISPLSFINPVGGHIHLGVPKEMSTLTAKNRAKLLCALSTAILVAEHPISSKYRRSQNSYGRLHDVKVEQKFTHPNGQAGYTVEMRFPTAEWLLTPKVAEATLTFAAVAWDAIINDSSFRQLATKIAYSTNGQAEAITEIVTSKLADVGEFYISKIRQVMRTAPRYAENKALMEFAMNPEAVLKAKENAGWLINQGWKFSKVQTSIQINKKTFLSEKKLKEALASKDDQQLAQFWPIAYNEDLNVAQFANAISARVAAYGWKPERDLFLFGLKTGVEEIVATDGEGGFYSGERYGIALQETLEKMTRRAKEKSVRRGKKIDIRTGMVTQYKEPIVIGIPRSMRENSDMTKFLALVLDIERGKKAVRALPEEAISLKEEITTPELSTSSYSEEGIIQNIESVRNQIALESQEPIVNLGNINRWNRSGSYTIARADTMIQLGEEYQSFEQAAPEQIFGVYDGSGSSLVFLGDNMEAAYQYISQLFDIQDLPFSQLPENRENGFKISANGYSSPWAERARIVPQLFTDSPDTSRITGVSINLTPTN